MTLYTRLANTLILVVTTLFFCAGLASAAGDPPSAPDNLQGTITGDQVTLSWDASTNDDGLVGYNVYVDNSYRATVFDTSYTGEVTEGKLTSFYLHAFDTIPRLYSPASEELLLPETLIPSDLTIPPTTPVDLTGVIADGEVTIEWSASTDDEAVRGYNVYRDKTYWATVFDTSYTTANAADETHIWQVVAFDIRENYSTFSQSITVPDTGVVDTTAPSAPVFSQAEAIAGATSDTVLLAWQPSTDDQAVRGYNMYINGQYTDTLFTTEYETQVPSGSQNTFAVVAFDFAENYSIASEEAVLQAPTDPVDPPSAPTELSVATTTANGETVVTLEWSQTAGTNPVRGYNVYRDNDYLSTVFTTSATDTLPVGTGATYYVIAFDNSENYSPRSETISILGAINQPPFFASLSDQQLNIDELWELVLRPVDVDDDPAGVLVSELPMGMQLVDNLDGSSTLSWEPGIADIGEYDIEVTAFDLLDTSISSSQTIKVTVTNDPATGLTPFSLEIAEVAFNLIEGNEQGTSIPIIVNRKGGFDLPITLSVQTQTEGDADQLSTAFSTETLDDENISSILNVQLAIDTLPLLPEQRRLIVTASAEQFNVQASITLAVTPVQRDDIYLLIGQSNMVGSSEPDAKLAGPGEPDEPNVRILQPNVTANDAELINNQPITDNVFDLGIPLFLPAEDPLHLPIDPSSGLKAGSRVGMGLSFAKAALPNTTRNIVLVPAAWSGSAFCSNDNIDANWNPVTTDNPELGNTLLFDRALERVNQTLEISGGILRGILWHQGESDSNERCAQFYEDNLVTLVEALRTRILPDARGEAARDASADVPFVVGTMSKGRDDESDFSVFSEDKTSVDDVHRNISSIVPFSAVTNNDDLIPDNGYPCGNGTCIHFGAAALREMGVRTYDSLLRAADSQ